MEKSIFAERRVAVKALMAKNSIVILSAAREFIRNRDSEYAFRQSSDLLYLTGFNERQIKRYKSSKGDSRQGHDDCR